jgi:hypothetical protein
MVGFAEAAVQADGRFKRQLPFRNPRAKGLPDVPGVYRDNQSSHEEHKALQLVYRPLNKKPAERKVNPYVVHLHNGTLYVIGYCHLRKDIRSFVIDRMEKIRLTDEAFPAPLGFSLESICAIASACSRRTWCA